MTELCLNFSMWKLKIKEMKWREMAECCGIKLEFLAWGRGERMVAFTKNYGWVCGGGGGRLD